jgi:hypothetical protein
MFISLVYHQYFNVSSILLLLSFLKNFIQLLSNLS